MNKNIVLTTSIILLLIISGISMVLHNQNNELKITNENLQISLNNINTIEINELKNENLNTIKYAEKYNEANTYMWYGHDSMLWGIEFWEYAFEDTYTYDPTYLDISTDYYKDAKKYFEKSNVILNEIYQLTNNQDTKIEIKQKIEITNAGTKYSENLINGNNKYSLSGEYYDDTELSDRYYNQYLDIDDKSNDLSDKYFDELSEMLLYNYNIVYE